MTIDNLIMNYKMIDFYKKRFEDKFSPAPTDIYVVSNTGAGLTMICKMLLDSAGNKSYTKEDISSTEQILTIDSLLWNDVDHTDLTVVHDFNYEEITERLTVFHERFASMSNPYVRSHAIPYMLVNLGKLKIKDLINIRLTKNDYIVSKLITYIKYNLFSKIEKYNNDNLSQVNNMLLSDIGLNIAQHTLNYREKTSAEQANQAIKRIPEAVEWTRTRLPMNSRLFTQYNNIFYEIAVLNAFVNYNYKSTVQEAFTYYLNSLLEDAENYKNQEINTHLLENTTIHNITYEDLFFNLNLPSALKSIDKSSIIEYSQNNLNLIEEAIEFCTDPVVKNKIMDIINEYYSKMFYIK